MPNDFGALGIRSELVDALKKTGVKEPTPVQEKAIPVLLTGKDVIAQAQTGTGKTLAFLLPILERVNPKIPAVQALVLTPTRELALQITTEAKKLAPTVGAEVLAAYGGQDVDKQIKKLEGGGAHIVIATPGRLLDHLKRGVLRLTRVELLVLDEADQMLHMGFLEDVGTIIGESNPQRQIMLCSATMPREIRALAKRFMKKPEEIQIAAKRVTLEEIEQIVIETTEEGKVDALSEKIKEVNPYLGVIFCRTRQGADKLETDLIQRGFNVDVLHGDLSQNKREQVMRKFRTAETHLLIATDIAARGIDVEGVTHVFNFDIPRDVDTYIHRIGRTGRAGETGTAITFVVPRERVYLNNIERGIEEKIAKAGAEIDLGDGPPKRKVHVPRETAERRPRSRTARAKAELETRAPKLAGRVKRAGAKSGGRRGR